MTIISPADIDWSEDQPTSSAFGDIYFSRDGGDRESRHVFLEGNNLPSRFAAMAAHDSFTIIETGFGTGLNWLCTQALRAETDYQGWLHYVSIEKHPLTQPDLQRAHAYWPAYKPYSDALHTQYPMLVPGFHRLVFPEFNSTLTLVFLNVEDALPRLTHPTDAWFLDGFSPRKNPEMWQAALYAEMARLSHTATTVATFTVASIVKQGLTAHQFLTEKRAGFGQKREMLTARFMPHQLDNNEAKTHQLPHKKPWLYRPSLARDKRKNQQAIVIGAGIAGASTARALADRGWRVTVFDAEKGPGSADWKAASGNPAAIIAPKLSIASEAHDNFHQQAYLFTLTTLARLPNASMYWKPCGVLQLLTGHQARDAEKLAEHPWHNRLAHALNTDEATNIAGIPIHHAAHYFPQAGYLLAAPLCQDLLTHPNIHYLPEHQLINYQQTSHGDWQVWCYKNDSIITPKNPAENPTAQAPILVLAGGAAMLKQHDTHSFNCRAVRGQISSPKACAESRALNTVLCYDGYITPVLANDRHCLGATFTPDSHSLTLKNEDHEKNHALLAQVLPALSTALNTNMHTEGRASLRCQSHDYLPIVGPIADTALMQQAYEGLRDGRAHPYPTLHTKTGLYAHLAHGSKGFTQAFLCADILAAEINHEPPPISKEWLYRLHPMRFFIKDIKRSSTH